VVKQLIAKASTGFSGAVVQFVVLNALVKGGWVLAENIVQNRIGHVEYGKYAAALQLALLGTVVFDLAAGTYLTKQLATRGEAISKSAALLGGFIGIRLALTLVYFILLGGIALGLGYSSADWHVLGALVVAGAVLNWLALLRNIFQAQQRWGIDAFASVADKAALLVLVPLLLAGSVGAFGLSLALLAAAAFAFAVFLGIAWRQLPSIRRWSSKPSSVRLGASIVRGSIPFVTYALILSALERVGQIGVERLAGPEASGLFAAAFRWTSAALMGIYLLQPWFFARFSSASLEERKRLVIRGTALFSLGMALVSMVFIGYPEIVLGLLSHSTESELRVITEHLMWQSIALWITGCFVVLGTHEAATGNLRGLRVGLALVLLLYIIALCAVVRTHTAHLTSILLLLAWGAQSTVYAAQYLWRSSTWAVSLQLLISIGGSALVLTLGLGMAHLGVGAALTTGGVLMLSVLIGAVVWRMSEVKVS
jgi:hypothetical protein